KALTDILDGCIDCDTPSCSVSDALFGCAARSCPCCGRADLSKAL
ncbi:MAG: hypothetical protein JKY57_05965, partial [Kordiimonadaceae bacterium]|nr:hypothetical protein [Kordiimonadaceae bacterium]